MLNAFIEPSAFGVWECLAGNDPLASYGPDSTEELLRNVPDHLIGFLKECCCKYHETDSFIFVHAGIRSHISSEEEDAEHLQWTVLSSASPHFSAKTTICGHSSQETRRIADLGHTGCIDTGITYSLSDLSNPANSFYDLPSNSKTFCSNRPSPTDC